PVEITGQQRRRELWRADNRRPGGHGDSAECGFNQVEREPRLAGRIREGWQGGRYQREARRLRVNNQSQRNPRQDDEYRARANAANDGKRHVGLRQAYRFGLTPNSDRNARLKFDTSPNPQSR